MCKFRPCNRSAISMTSTSRRRQTLRTIKTRNFEKKVLRITTRILDVMKSLRDQKIICISASKLLTELQKCYRSAKAHVFQKALQKLILIRKICQHVTGEFHLAGEIPPSPTPVV